MQNNPNTKIISPKVTRIKPRTTYIKVGFPQNQVFMEHPRWNECIYCIEITGHPCEYSTYMIPKDIYDEVYGLKDSISRSSK